MYLHAIKSAPAMGRNPLFIFYIDGVRVNGHERYRLYDVPDYRPEKYPEDWIELNTEELEFLRKMNRITL